MTPERIREAIADVEGRQERMGIELNALAEVGDALRRLLAATEQPGQGERSSGVEAPAERTAATTPAPAQSLTQSRVACPDCGALFHRPGLGPHRARKHGVRAGGAKVPRGEAPTSGRGARPPVIGKARTEPELIVRDGKHTFLCSRCDAPFESREALAAHMSKGHPPDSIGGSTLRPLGQRDPLTHHGGAVGAVKLG